RDCSSDVCPSDLPVRRITSTAVRSYSAQCGLPYRCTTDERAWLIEAGEAPAAPVGVRSACVLDMCPGAFRAAPVTLPVRGPVMTTRGGRGVHGAACRGAVRGGARTDLRDDGRPLHRRQAYRRRCAERQAQP